MAKLTPLPKELQGSAGKEAAKLLSISSRNKSNVPKTRSNGPVGARVAGRDVPGATQVSGGNI